MTSSHQTRHHQQQKRQLLQSSGSLKKPWRFEIKGFRSDGGFEECPATTNQQKQPYWSACFPISALSLDPDVDRFDLLLRAWKLEEAYMFIREMPIKSD
ncbi:hypothetical protein Hanom_Chr04g00380731 [Helianthus anomalus]